MDILNAILSARNGQAVNTLASQFGLSSEQTSSAIGALLPALAGGLQRNVSQPGGLEALAGALTSGNHDRYLDDPGRLSSGETVADGNAILGHLLGSKDVSRSVATSAAASTGLSPDLLKQLLPFVASLAMGALAKQSAGAGAGNQISPGSLSGSLGSLSSFLDANRDGSIVDDVLGQAGKLFNR